MPKGVRSLQDFAEKLFKRLHKSAGERFEVRLAMMSVISRVMGVHRLLLLNFYPFMQKYVLPHQRDAPVLLAVLVQVRSPSCQILNQPVDQTAVCSKGSCACLQCTSFCPRFKPSIFPLISKYLVSPVEAYYPPSARFMGPRCPTGRLSSVR